MSKTTTFAYNVKVKAGPAYEIGKYLFSNPANWTNGVPVDGDDVIIGQNGGTGAPLDDLASLHLAELTLLQEAALEVDGTSLTIDHLVASSDADGLELDAEDTGHPVTATIGTLDSTGVDYDADGKGARLIVQSATDLGNIFSTADGGFIDLAAPPSADSELYWGEDGVFAFRRPAAVNHCALENLAPGSILELPGSKVVALTIGVSSLNVTTDAGSYAFDHVGPNDVDIRTFGYTVAQDSTTGLVAITFTGGEDVFRTVERASSGRFAGSYLWSDAANWSISVPADGATVKVDPGNGATALDNLGSLTLANLMLGGNGHVSVPTGSLTVSTVQAESGGSLVAGMVPGTAGAITVDAVTGTGATFGADGAGARFVDAGTTDAGDTYQAGDGGFTELHATPADASILSYVLGNGTLALDHPGPVTVAALTGVAPGDVLELPGTAASAATFGSDSLSVTTDAGTYAFNHVSYGSPVTGYTAATDPATGLVALTFTGPDIFEQNVRAASGPYAGDYLWSDPANWSRGVPVNGDSVSVSGANLGVDDLGSLALARLELDDSQLNVVGTSLGVTAMAVAAGASLVAGYLTPNAVTVTLGTVQGANGLQFADGPAGRIVNQSSADPGGYYHVNPGGVDELSAPAAATSTLAYSGGGTFALHDPGPVTAAALTGVAPGDVLELPGTAASAATFGSDSLSVTTDAGTCAFNHVSYGSPVTGYTAATDPATGLVAVTFTGPDIFESNVLDGGGAYLWSNPANWSRGVPSAESAVLVSNAPGVQIVDDLPNLTLASLSIGDNAGLEVVANHLTLKRTLAVGVGGAGRLTIPGGTEVTAAAIDVEPSGEVLLEGGVLDPPVPVAIAAGASVSGSGTIEAAVDTQGALEARGGVLKIDGAVTGTGSLTIDTGATLDLDSGAAPGADGAVGGGVSSAVVFASADGTLSIDQPRSFTGSITPSFTAVADAGQSAGDQIQLVGLGAGQVTSSYRGNGNGGTLTIADNAVATALNFIGVFNTHSFVGNTQNDTPVLTLTVGQGGPDPATESYFGTIIHDPQSPVGEVYALYDGLLGRVPDAPGFSYWATQLSNGSSLADVVSGFLNSEEFTNGFGGPATGNTDDTFVEHLYQVALGRPADSSGLAHWDGVLASGNSRADVALDFATSPENEHQLAPALQAGVFEPDATDAALARLYYAVFARSPDGDGLLNWEHQAQSGVSLDSIAGEFLQSPEYQGQHTTAPDNAAFVSQLYSNTLGRAANDPGAQSWVADLNAGSLTRSAVTVAVATSAEAQVHLFPLVEGGTLLLT